MEQREESIDLGRLWSILWRRKAIAGGIVAVCTILAFIVANLLPKQYASTTLVQMRSVSGGGAMGNASALATSLGIDLLGGSKSSASPMNYIELMKSRRVLDPIIDSLEWEDEKKKPAAEDFAKSNLDIKNTKQTNLISITAKGRTPEEAQTIAKGVVDNFLAMQTDMNQQTQSLLVTFLDDRIQAAKKDSEEADAALANYSSEHKIYSPDDQVKAAVEQLGLYDKAISDQQADYQSADAELSAVNAKLGEQAAGAMAYSINDNPTVQSIRSQIVEKEVELVGLQRQYTDKHPDVIIAKQSLAQLQRSLSNEVGAIVGSKAASLNTSQAALMTQQAQASAKRAVAQAAKSAFESEKAKQEAKMGDLPDAIMKYMQLKSDSKIKNTVYTTLVDQRESKRIQEAMESMDIQVIDEANLPDEDAPAAPRKKRITAIGFAIGVLLTLGYGLVAYKREA